jgi:AcrR family transcriptional regulator
MPQAMNEQAGPARHRSPTGSRAGRPTAEAAARKRAQILDAAVEVFTRHGFAGTSMDEIAATARVSKPTVYARFGSKQDLLKAAIWHVVENRGPPLGQSAQADDPVEGLQQLIAEILKRTTDPVYLGIFRLFLTEAAVFPEVFDAFSKSMVEGTQLDVEGYIARHAALHSPSAPPEQIASTILALVGNVVMVTATRRSAAPVEAEAEAERIVRTVLYGCLPR